MFRRTTLFTAVLTLSVLIAGAQKQGPLSSTARLTAARTAYMKNAGGNDVPFDVITDGIKGWGRYQLVASPDKADLIIEVMSPSGGQGVSVTSTTSTDPRSGTPAQSVTSTHELQVSRITLIVYDAKSHVALWSATEQPKGALREKNRKDNVVHAAQSLVSKLRERVDPDTPK